MPITDERINELYYSIKLRLPPDAGEMLEEMASSKRERGTFIAGLIYDKYQRWESKSKSHRSPAKPSKSKRKST